jgi:hypothetical protein
MKKTTAIDSFVAGHHTYKKGYISLTGAIGDDVAVYRE